MKKFLLPLLLISLALAFQVAANGADEQPVGQAPAPQREELSSKAGDTSEIYPEAIGEWKYQLVSEDAVIGDMKITVAKETLNASACYRVEQSGAFTVSATETRRIQTTAHLRPDLTLIDYERSEEILENGRAKYHTRVQAEVGALTIAFLKDTGDGKPVKSEIKKTGPVYYAPGAAWILLRTSNLKPGQGYRFDNWLPESGDIREATIDVIGPVAMRVKGNPETVLRVRVSNGLGSMIFHQDRWGGIISYGPESGEMAFLLVSE